VSSEKGKEEGVRSPGKGKGEVPSSSSTGGKREDKSLQNRGRRPLAERGGGGKRLSSLKKEKRKGKVCL